MRTLYVCALLGVFAVSQAQAQSNIDKPFQPINLSLQPAEPESVYAPPMLPRDDQGINQGAVHFDLSVGYFTDYVYRGIEIFEPPGAEDRPNLQVDSRLSFDLGKLPHPFVDVFVNYADADPISSFQEIRPVLGAEWNIRPLIVSAGHTSYIYPNRDQFATSEVWGKIQIDDSYFLRTAKPLLSPYILAAYDYDLYNGWYFEAGVSHDFPIEDTGLTITANAHAAYVRGFELFAIDPASKDVNGFQHYQLGLIATYSLNTLFNFPTRYGSWSLQGFVYYTDKIDEDLNANTQIWGGAGIAFHY
ncbi:MAG TPA: hypothetical protein VHD56_16155 [Tepidisphaeraceae bacterium]|nr:hypothetical protein [Tepidisphaeraceae bacterium]